MDRFQVYLVPKREVNVIKMMSLISREFSETLFGSGGEQICQLIKFRPQKTFLQTFNFVFIAITTFGKGWSRENSLKFKIK